jgi:hypothetical protein
VGWFADAEAAEGAGLEAGEVAERVCLLAEAEEEVVLAAGGGVAEALEKEEELGIAVQVGVGLGVGASAEGEAESEVAAAVATDAGETSTRLAKAVRGSVLAGGRAEGRRGEGFWRMERHVDICRASRTRGRPSLSVSVPTSAASTYSIPCSRHHGKNRSRAARIESAAVTHIVGDWGSHERERR